MGRRLLIACVTVLLVPALIGFGAFLLLRQGVISKYDRCVSSLTVKERRLGGLALVVDALKEVPSLTGVEWKLNEAYDPKAINILVPSSADGRWHVDCGLPEAPADCLAAARERFIICNAAVGRQLSNPLLSSGIAREEIYRARLFLAVAFLGHELGHLQASSPAVGHLLPTNRANGLRCNKPDPQLAPSEEQRADDYGIALACEAVKGASVGQVATDSGSALRTLTHLRESIDEDYFAFDDTCVGDDRYPSMSRRKSEFAHAYARCLFPQSDLPFAGLAGDQAAAFGRLEAWLRQRQLSGLIASTLYGRGAVYHFDIASTSSSKTYIALDSTGTRSEVVSTTIGSSRVEHTTMSEWECGAEPIDIRGGQSVAEFLLTCAAVGEETDVRRVVVRCTGDPAQCRSEVQTKRVPGRTVLRSTQNHTIVEILGKTVRTYASAADFMAGAVAIDTVLEEDLGEGRVAVAGEALRLLLASIPPEVGLASGFHRIALLGRSGVRWIPFTTLPENVSPIKTVGRVGDQVALVFQPAMGQLEDRVQLWLCPVQPFESAGTDTSAPVACDVYRPPEDAYLSIGLANNDLTSLGTSMDVAENCVGGGAVVLKFSGWLWLVDPRTKTQDLVPGAGLVGCSEDRKRATVYRMRRVDEVALDFQEARPNTALLALVRSATKVK